MADNEEDDFVTFGTPLDPLDEGELPRKKPIPIEEQIATDEQGRRRFHGAFTGGFSAGFFNSVGSLEGWTPSTFKSSRGEKAGKKFLQKPEDFMDDEDLGQFGIAPRVLRAKADYNDQPSKKRKLPSFEDGPIPGTPVLSSLFEPVKETIGARILKKMGWKPGQGVGPRISKAEKIRTRKEQAKGQKVYGCSLPMSLDEDDDDSDEELEDLRNLTFAPEDIKIFLCKPKDNVFGIGYVGLNKNPVLGRINLFESSHLKCQDKNKKVNIRGQAFGVGVFEDEDEDVYNKEDMSRYDFSLGPSSSKPKKSRFEPLMPQVEVLEGFIFTTRLTTHKKIFPAPKLPENYKVVHSTKKSRFEQLPKENVPQKKPGLDRHSMTAVERGVLMNHQDDTKKILENAKALIITTKESTEEESTNIREKKEFQPFAAFPEKQARYEEYLKLVKIGQKEKLSTLQPFTMTQWDKQREHSEFEQAARIYRPLQGFMDDRFVTAIQADDDLDPMKPVNRMLHGSTEQHQAAKSKMFGKLTRKIEDWFPTSIVCKRFNIPEPHLGMETPKQKTKIKFALFDFMSESNKESSDLNQILSIPIPKENKKMDTLEETKINKETITEVEVEIIDEINRNKPEENVINEQFKENKTKVSISEFIKDININPEEDIILKDPSEKIDLFKAIFLSSSDESSSEETEEKIEENPPPRTIIKPKSPEPEIIRSRSPARGLFANLDLEALAMPQPKNDDQVMETIQLEEDSVLPEGSYGPVLPRRGGNLLPNSISSVIKSVNIEKTINSPTTSQWVEKKVKHKHKKEKKSKHKHKKTKKHKKSKD